MVKMEYNNCTTSLPLYLYLLLLLTCCLFVAEVVDQAEGGHSVGIIVHFSNKPKTSNYSHCLGFVCC